jgi:Protein of unknown function (DUF1236)
MKPSTALTLAAAALLCGATASSAAEMSHPSPTSTMSRPLSDILNLSRAQRETAWNDLRREAIKQKAPLGFKATVGSVVPATLKIEPVPGKVASAIPSLRPYDFAMVHGKLIIINPADKRVAEVIKG